MDCFLEALPNIKSMYVALKDFTPASKNLHRYICRICDIMQLWCQPSVQCWNVQDLFPNLVMYSFPAPERFSISVLFNLVCSLKSSASNGLGVSASSSDPVSSSGARASIIWASSNLLVGRNFFRVNLLESSLVTCGLVQGCWLKEDGLKPKFSNRWFHQCSSYPGMTCVEQKARRGNRRSNRTAILCLSLGHFPNFSFWFLRWDSFGLFGQSDDTQSLASSLILATNLISCILYSRNSNVSKKHTLPKFWERE